MAKFHYVYVLRSRKDGRFYTGSRSDLKARFKLHNAGQVQSTRPRRPFELVFYEAFRSRADAKRREVYLKTTKGKATLQVMLREFLEENP